MIGQRAYSDVSLIPDHFAWQCVDGHSLLVRSMKFVKPSRPQMTWVQPSLRQKRRSNWRRWNTLGIISVVMLHEFASQKSNKKETRYSRLYLNWRDEILFQVSKGDLRLIFWYISFAVAVLLLKVCLMSLMAHRTLTENLKVVFGPFWLVFQVDTKRLPSPYWFT